MSYWIHMVMLIIQSFTNDEQVKRYTLWTRSEVWETLTFRLDKFFERVAEGVFYVSEEKVLSDKAASSCYLATPDIHFGKDWNTISLDGADLNISETEPVWSGYVQTYAAFLYEGCCEEQFAKSSANYTNMPIDPGKCYSKCKTDVIGIQATTCHCNPRPTEKNTHATGCDSLCSNPAGTVCGGNDKMSVYRKVQYAGSGGRAATENENCRALNWQNNGRHSYSWNNCWDANPFLCDIDVTSSTEFEYRLTRINWRSTVRVCLQYNETTAVEVSAGYPDINYSKSELFWIGQIRSHVIGNDEESNYQAPGWRRGVITKAGGEYVLLFNTHPSMLKSLCENVSSSETINDEPQFPIIAVYATVPAVLVIIAVVVIVILCKRRRNTECGKDDPAFRQKNNQTSTISTNAVVNYSHQECGVEHEYFTLEPVNIHAVVKGAAINAAIDNEYDTCTHLHKKVNAMSNESGNVYNTLEDIADDTYNHTNTTTSTNVDDTYDNATFDEHG